MQKRCPSRGTPINNQVRTAMIRQVLVAVNDALTTATFIQDEGTIYHSPLMLEELFNCVNTLDVEDELEPFDEQQRLIFKIAGDLAHFLQRLQGIRLRVVGNQELNRIEMKSMEPTRATSNPIKLSVHEGKIKETGKKSAKPSDHSFSSSHPPLLQPQLSEAELTILQHEQFMRAVDEASAAAVKKEEEVIKEEPVEELEPDFMPPPGLHQLQQDGRRDSSQLEETRTNSRDMKEEVEDGDYNYYEYSATDGLHCRLQPQSFQQLRPAAGKRAHQLPVMTVGQWKQLRKEEESAAAAATATAAAKISAATLGSFPNRHMYRSVMDLQAPVQQPQQLQPKSIPKIGRCTKYVCDFTCDSLGKMTSHNEALHGAAYRQWMNEGRFRLETGSRCPYCSRYVNDVAALHQHLLKDHNRRMQRQGNIFSCSSCARSFNRLHLVYDHWCTNSLCKGPIRLPDYSSKPSNQPRLLQSREFLEKRAELITGSRGMLGFKEMAQRKETGK